MLSLVQLALDGLACTALVFWDDAARYDGRLVRLDVGHVVFAPRLPTAARRDFATDIVAGSMKRLIPNTPIGMPRTAGVSGFGTRSIMSQAVLAVRSLW